MKKKFILFGTIIGICIIVTATVLILTKTSVEASPTEILEECQTLQYNSENAINIVFFAEKSVAEEYTDYLFTYPPFSETQDKFNIYLIDNSQYKPECELYRGIALYCYSSEIVKKAASCPNDYIIVLEEQPKSIRSSAYKNVMSLNEKVPKTVLLHEIAHAISSKAEEYLAPGASIPRKADNCVKSCEKFNDLNDACEQECTTSTLYRSYDKGIMRTLYPDIVTYGKFNEETMKEDILEQTGGTTITSNAIAESTNCEDKSYTLIQANTDENGNLRIIAKTSEIGCATGFGKGDTEIQIFNENNQLIAQESANMDYFFSSDDNPEGLSAVPIQNPQLDVFFAVQDETNAQTIQFTHNDEETIVSIEDAGARPCRI